jgi:hypothetical protein
VDALGALVSRYRATNGRPVSAHRANLSGHRDDIRGPVHTKAGAVLARCSVIRSSPSGQMNRYCVSSSRGQTGIARPQRSSALCHERGDARSKRVNTDTAAFAIAPFQDLCLASPVKNIDTVFAPIRGRCRCDAARSAGFGHAPMAGIPGLSVVSGCDIAFMARQP